MNASSSAAREDMLGKIMGANSLLLQMKAHLAGADPQDRAFFTALMPHLEEALAELAEHVFFAPPRCEVTAESLRELLRLRQEQTLDIHRFEAYRYLLARI